MKLVSLFGLTLLTAPCALPQNNPKRMPDEVAVFAVRQDEQTTWLDPIVVIRYGSDQRHRIIPSLDRPLPDQSAPSDFRSFEHRFYRNGRVSLFRGGERLGETVISQFHSVGEEGGCSLLSATIADPGGPVPLLAATAITEIPGHRPTRRLATPVEASNLRQLMTAWLAEYGLDNTLLRQGKLGPVVVTKLRSSGGMALIGRYDVKSKRSVHRLFAVAERSDAHYRLTLTDIHVQQDLEDGQDRTETKYVDQLDIDNDGVDEIITSADYYENWDYSVWRIESNGAWSRAYTGRGGGC